MLAIVCPEHSTRLLRAYNHFAAWLLRFAICLKASFVIFFILFIDKSKNLFTFALVVRLQWQRLPFCGKILAFAIILYRY